MFDRLPSVCLSPRIHTFQSDTHASQNVRRPTLQPTYLLARIHSNGLQPQGRRFLSFQPSRGLVSLSLSLFGLMGQILSSIVTVGSICGRYQQAELPLVGCLPKNKSAMHARRPWSGRRLARAQMWGGVLLWQIPAIVRHPCQCGGIRVCLVFNFLVYMNDIRTWCGIVRRTKFICCIGEN